MESASTLAVPVLTSFIGIMFLYSGVAKLSSLRSFIDGLWSLPLLPAASVRWVGRAVPVIELIAGLCVLLDQFWAKALVLLMLGVFSVIAILASGGDKKIPCNCFGVESSEFLSGWTAVRNGGLATIVLLTMVLDGAYSSVLTNLYGFVLLLLFLGINTAIRNQQQFANVLNWRPT